MADDDQDMEQRVKDLEAEARALRKKLDDLSARIDATEPRGLPINGLGGHRARG